MKVYNSLGALNNYLNRFGVEVLSAPQFLIEYPRYAIKRYHYNEHVVVKKSNTGLSFRYIDGFMPIPQLLWVVRHWTHKC